jgi:hypothetical protein
MPWLAPCCSDCAQARAAGEAGAAGDAAAPSSGQLSTGTGALLVLGGMAVILLWGDQILRKLGG